MEYCKSCKALCFGDELPFDGCRHKLLEIKDINEPVRLCIVGGTERAMLRGMLKDADIPFEEVSVSPRGVSNDIVTGYDVKLSNVNVLVPYSALLKASELLGTIETLQNVNEPLLAKVEEDIGKYKAGTFSGDRQLSPAMRTTVKVVTAILFFILVAIVVFGTDKIIELIKGLFGG